jgi:hypothetical protein
MKTIATETKIAIAHEVIVNGMNKDDVAAKYGVSERSVRRYKAEFASVVAEQELARKEAEKAVQPSKLVARRSEGYDIPLTKKGGRKHNGRVRVFYTAIESVGIDAPIAALFEEVNKLSVEAGLSVLNKASVSAMRCSYRRMINANK